MTDLKPLIIVVGFDNVVAITSLINTALITLDKGSSILPYTEKAKLISDIPSFKNPVFIIHEKSNGEMGLGTSLIESIEVLLEKPKVIFICKEQSVLQDMQQRFPDIYCLEETEDLFGLDIRLHGLLLQN